MVIAKALYKELQKINKQEEKWLSAKERNNVVKDKIYEKVPDGLSHTLELAFEKAFSLVFLKGRKILEKTFDKEALQMEFTVGDQLVEQRQTKKSVKLLGKKQERDNLINHASTTATGFGLGLLGMGLPDIPLLVSTILKGLYEVALSYGFSYESKEEQIYMLRLIRIALATGEDRRKVFSELITPIDSRHVSPFASESASPIDSEIVSTAGSAILSSPDSGSALPAVYKVDLSEEIKRTAKALSDALLVEKFVQGIPIVGVVGGFVNHTVYKKILFLGKLEYKKRYLLSKGK